MPIESRPIETVFASTAPGAEVITFPNWGRGWGLTFDPGQTEGVPPMEWFNSAFQILNKGMRYLVQRGISEWTATETYPQHGLCQYNGSFFYAKVASTNQVPNPAAETTYWRKTMLTANDLGTMAVQNADAVNITGGTATLSDLAVSKQVTSAVHPVSITNTSTSASSGVALYLQKGAGGANGRGGLNYVPGVAMKLGTLANDAAASVSLSVNNTDKITATTTAIALLDDTSVTGAFAVTGNSILTGNLTVVGSSRRFQADFSNATASNRMWFQSSTLNGNTVVGIMPNGSNISSGLTLSSSSDVLNASIGAISLDTTSYRINSSSTGTGSVLPIDIQMGGTTGLRMFTNRNIRVGSSPTTDAGYTFQIGGTLLVTGSTDFTGGANIADRSFSSKSYSVGVGAWVTIALNSDGDTVLTAGKNYEVSVTATNTGSTASAAKYLVYQTAAGTWAARLISASSPGSVSTPQPAVRVSGTAVQISHSHTGATYNLQTSVVQYSTGNGTLTDLGYFGLAGSMSTIGGRVLVGDATDDGSSSMRATGSIAITGTGYFRQQADSTAGGAAAISLDAADGSPRWRLARRFVEAGSNVGSDLSLWSYNDNGTFKATVATFFRNTGNVLINGTADNAADKLQVAGSSHFTNNISIGGSSSNPTVSLRTTKNVTGGSVAYNVLADGIVQSDVVDRAYGVQTRLNTQATSFNLTQFHHFSASGGTVGAGSTVTNQYGFLVDATMTGATFNYGYYGNLAAGTNRWNLYMVGTALNYMNGALLLGSNTDNGTDKLQVTGSASFTGAVTTSASHRVVSNGFTTILSNLSDGASLSTTGTNNSLQFYTNSTLRFKVLTDGSLVAGGLAQSIGGAAALLTLPYAGGATAGIVIKPNAANDGSINTAITFLRASNNTTTGTIEQKVLGGGLLLTGTWSVAAPADNNRSDRIPSTQWVANNFSKTGSYASNNLSQNSVNGTITKTARISLGDIPSGGTSGTFNWPTAFPNGVETCQLTVLDSTGNRNVFGGLVSYTTTGFTWWVNENSAQIQSITLEVFAMGN